jgi:hypothetical protein
MVGKDQPHGIGAAFLGWIYGLVDYIIERDRTEQALLAATNESELDRVVATIPPEKLAAGDYKPVIDQQRSLVGNRGMDLEDPLKEWIKGLLTGWKESIAQLDMKDPTKATDNLATLTEDVLGIAVGAAVIDLALGALPNGEGYVSAMTSKQLLGWLGFGAVLAAAAHDPVKIGVLRPYQDNLEATFRNRRPDDNALFQAYRTRELDPTEITDLSTLNQALMDKIEVGNDQVYFTQIAKWGYSATFATSLARSATRTPTFGNLVTLAREGLLNQGLAIYSLWGYGMDRVTMKPLLEALDKLTHQASYAGFRSLIEPSFVSGDISEEDLVAYYDRIAVPKEVQAWVLPRLRKARAKAMAVKPAVAKERDLTVSQIQDAYVKGLVDRGTAQNWLADLKPPYEPGEVEILLKLADARKKTPGVAKLKRLPLSDYEKAFKNKIRTAEQVLERMQGEYEPGDIALEAELLKIGKE